MTTTEELTRQSRAGSRLPLNFWDDPRWDVGSSGVHLLALLVTWTADHLTDGAIPASRLRMLASMTDDPEAAVQRLTEARLLVDHPDGVAIPMEVFVVFNLTSAQVAAIQEQTRLAGQKGGASRVQTALRDPAGRLLPSTPTRRPSGVSPDDHPDHRLDSLDQTTQTPLQTTDQTRLPSPVSPSSVRTGQNEEKKKNQYDDLLDVEKVRSPAVATGDVPEATTARVTKTPDLEAIQDVVRELGPGRATMRAIVGGLGLDYNVRADFVSVLDALHRDSLRRPGERLFRQVKAARPSDADHWLLADDDADSDGGATVGERLETIFESALVHHVPS